MLDPARFNAIDPTISAPKARPVFRMQDNDRMAGSVPVWDSRPAPQTQIEAQLSGTEQNTGNFTHAMSYAESAGHTAAAEEEPFGFFDLLDMVNPLQHIPIVSTLYRSVTGDEIKPVAKIVGGTIFGGPAGGAASFANVIIEHETGRDLTGNVMAMVRDGEKPQWRSTTNNPEQRLNEALDIAAAERTALDSLPASTLSFADTRQAARPQHTRYYALHEDDRMAGTRPRYNS
ncbi:MAG: hypothetical protein KKA05_03700 [Alphaproteobacteria bacterium]|nr:hypothetical protein [Alphaproteobacteria bacterium]MBU0858957.1 hypothetical protein [Alphaproteobacteria bacterium]